MDFIGPLYRRTSPCPGTDWTLVVEEVPPPSGEVARVFLLHRDGGIVRTRACYTQAEVAAEAARMAGPVLHPDVPPLLPRDFRCPTCGNVERDGLLDPERRPQTECRKVCTYCMKGPFHLKAERRRSAA